MPGCVPPWLHLSGRYGEQNIELLQVAIPDRSISKLRLEDFTSPIDPVFLEALRRLLHHRPIDSVTLQGGNLLPDDIGTTKHLILRNVEVRPAAAWTLLRFNYLVSLSLISMSLSVPLVTVLAETKFQTLDLNDSRFLGDGAAILSQGLRNNTSLKCLGLSECNLMDEQIALIVQSLHGNPSLRELDISFNKCRSSGMTALARLLESSSTSIVKLCMSFLAFGEAKQIELEEFCTALASNQTLKELELGANSLRDGDMPYLIEALCSCKLKSLDLSQNRFTSLSPIAVRLGELKYLRQLSIDDNRLEIDSLDALVDSLSSSNVVLENVEMDNVLERSGMKGRMLYYYLDLNWGGRRLLSQDGENAPLSLWPLILERANDMNKESADRLTRAPVSGDIIYFFLRSFPVITSLARSEKGALRNQH
jgi:hypothetical protein